MSFTAISYQPRPSGIVREKHLSENIWIKKVTRSIYQGHLEQLDSVNEIHINRKIKKGGTICDGQHSYRITDQYGKSLLKASEESTCFCVHCCGPSRSYALHIQSLDGTDLIKLERPFRCDDNCWCCCGCGLMEMKIFDAISEELLGKVSQRWSLWKEKFCVENDNKSLKITILGPSVACRCFSNMIFKVCAEDGEEIGKIWKKWKEPESKIINQDHEHIGITFDNRMDVETKTLLLGAAFLLNHMFFEMT